MTTAKRIAFLGLGVMGAPMAGHLARRGHHVTAYNRTAARAAEWLERYSGEGLDVATAPSPAEAAAGQEVVITCVGNDDDLAEVVLAEGGALAAMTAGALFIDHTTVSPAIARRIAAEAAERGVLALDAPVSGGQAGAENGKLAVMCGGSLRAMDSARPVLDAYSARTVHIGEAGAGQACKAVNQICISGVLAGLVRRHSLRAGRGSRHGPRARGDFGRRGAVVADGKPLADDGGGRIRLRFRNRLDAQGPRHRARRSEGPGLSLPVTALVDQFYAQVQAHGGARQDTSALIRHLPETRT